MQNYSIEEALQLIHIGRTKLYEELNSGRLKAFKLGKRTLIKQASIEEWLDNLPAYPVKELPDSSCSTSKTHINKE